MVRNETRRMDFISGFAASILHALLMLAVAQIPLKAPALFVQVALAALVHAMVAIVLATAGILDSYWHYAAAFSLGFMVYLFGFSALYKSISLRILVDIDSQPGGIASLDDIFKRVVMRSFKQRAEALVALGAVERVGSRYAVTDAGRRTAQRIEKLRKLIGCEGGGIYFKSDDR